jgi:uncharacterized membrane protein YjfL (UPF0719 family)
VPAVVTLFSSCRCVYVSSVGVLFSSVSVLDLCKERKKRSLFDYYFWTCVEFVLLLLNLTYGFLFELVRV